MKNLAIRRLLIGVLFLCVSNLSAQEQQQVSGKVTDDNGSPLPGANVQYADSNKGTVTDADGYYQIVVDEGATLIFSYIGYKAQTIKVGSRTTVDVVLSQNALLEEVVVIGYGTSRQEDLTGAISSLSSDDFEQQPVIRAEDALQARAAGVQVTKNTGAPGGDVKIRIRGSNSISFSNQPLVVIDGVIGGTLQSLNPNDIASIDVLKDASATAVYGSRGANGVIVVSTKKGEGGAKFDIEYFSSFSKIPKKIPLLSPEQFAEISGIDVVDGGTDYQDAYFRTALLHSVQLSTSGAADGLSYFVSGNYVDQEGIVFNSGYQRFSLRSNLELQANDKLKIGLNLFGSREHRHNVFFGGAGTAGDRRGGILGILGWDPTKPIRNPDGSYYQLQSSVGNILVNPVAVQTELDNNRLQDRFNANFNLSYDISESLNYRAIVGGAFQFVNNENYAGIPDGTTILSPIASYLSRRSDNYQISNILTWDKQIGASQLKLTGVFEEQAVQWRSASGRSGEFAIGGLKEAFYLLELGTDPSLEADREKSAIRSYVGRGELNFKDNLLLTATLRVDESSNFRKENRTGYFPSVSAAYSFQKLLPSNEYLDNVKLRLGYGEVGNQNVGALNTFSELPLGRDFAFDGDNEVVGLGTPTFKDLNLKWETTKQFNAGLDFFLVDSRILLKVDWFRKNTVDLLLRKPVPLYSGGGTFLTNVGEVQNTGVDLGLSASIINTDKFQWNANLNLSAVKNEAIDLGGQEQILIGAFSGSSSGSSFAIRVGEPLGQFYGATFLGTWKTADQSTGQVPGTSKYALDESGNPVLGVIGNGTPELTWGWNNTISYKNINLNFLLRGVHGFEVFNQTYSSLMFPANSGSASHADYLDRWTAENETEIPAGGTNLASTRYVEKGDFVRLSNITVSYTLEEFAPFRSVQVYVSGQNLLTITSYTGFDPEVSSSGASGSDGAVSFDSGAFPNPRTATIGVKIGL